MGNVHYLVVEVVEVPWDKYMNIPHYLQHIQTLKKKQICFIYKLNLAAFTAGDIYSVFFLSSRKQATAFYHEKIK